jgi:acetolactate synthase-1/3 small subunit
MHKEYVVIELLVNNHPGVMSHITGLFARRAFNLEGILCGRVEEEDSKKSYIYLLVKNDDFLEQIMKQLHKLYDVNEVKLHESVDYDIFRNLDRFFK